MSSDEEDARPAVNQGSLALRQTGAGSLPGSLLLGAVDALHHTVQVNCRLPLRLARPDTSKCRCYFGDQVVQASQDSNGTLFCYAPPPKPCRGRYAQEKSCTLNVVVDNQKVAEATFQYTALPFWRKPSLEGRFSGRLPTKEDEKKLSEECRLLAPLVGGTYEGRGERSMSSLAKLARAIASGRVRQHCEQREYRVQSLQQHVARLEAALHCGLPGLPGAPHANMGSAVALSAANATLQDEVRHLRNYMNAKDNEVMELRQQLRLKEQLCADLASGSCCSSALVPSTGHPLHGAALLGPPSRPVAANCPPSSSCAEGCDAGASGGRGGLRGGPPSPNSNSNSRAAKRQRQLQSQLPGCSGSAAAQGCCGGVPAPAAAQGCCGGGPASMAAQGCCGGGPASAVVPALQAAGSGAAPAHNSTDPLRALFPHLDPSSWQQPQQQPPFASAPFTPALDHPLLAHLQPGSSSGSMAGGGMGPLQWLLTTLQSSSTPPPCSNASASAPATPPLPSGFAPLESTAVPIPQHAPAAPAGGGPAAGPPGALGNGCAGCGGSMRSGQGDLDAARAEAAAAASVQALCAANPDGCCTDQRAQAHSRQGCHGLPHTAQAQQPQKQQEEGDVFLSTGGGLASPLVSLPAEGSLPDEDDDQECCFGLIDCSAISLDEPHVTSSTNCSQQRRPQAVMVPDPPSSKQLAVQGRQRIRPHADAHAHTPALPAQSSLAMHAGQQEQQQQDPEVLRSLTASLSTAQQQLVLLRETQERQAQAYQEQQTQLRLLQQYLSRPPGTIPFQHAPSGCQM